MSANTSSTGCYVPPGKRNQSLGTGLSMTRKPRFTLVNELFPTLSRVPCAKSSEINNSAELPTLSAFLKLIAKGKTPKTNKRKKKSKDPAIAAGLVWLPDRSATSTASTAPVPVPVSPPTADDYQRAARIMLTNLQADREAENRFLGADSRWILERDLRSPLTYEEEPDLLDWNGEEDGGEVSDRLSDSEYDDDY